MRLVTVVSAHVLALALAGLAASCASPPQPTYADVSYQTRCNTLAGGAITGCTEPMVRSISGFSGDNGNRFSCSVIQSGSTRTVNFQVNAAAGDTAHTALGVSLSGAVVATAGGAPSGISTFSWTDGNEYGGAAGGTAPSATQPCQIHSIDFTTDMMTGLPEMDINVHCVEAPSIPAATPAITRSLSAPGTSNTTPVTIRFYSCPIVQR